jgi:hypothetical protein
MKKLNLLLFAFVFLSTKALAQQPATRAFVDEQGVITTENVLGVQLPPAARDGLTPMLGFPLSFGSNTTYKPMRGLTLADLNNDGADEIILNHNEEINVIDGQGHVLWTRTLAGGMGQYPATVGDIDGDGTMEVVALTAYGNARGGINVFSNTGEVLLATETNNNPLICAPVLADLNNDGTLEIIFCGRGKTSAGISAGVHSWNLQGEEIDGFPFEMPSTPAFTPTLADIDGDGFLELFIATTSVLYCVSHTGEILYSVDGQESYKYSYQSPLVVDFDGDGEWSLVGACHGDSPNHYIRNAHTGEYRQGWPKSVNSWTYSAPTVMKNNDNFTIFMGVSGEGNVFYQYDPDGNIAPGFPLNLTSGIEGFISVADIDGDGENEIITDFNLMDNGEGFIRAWEMDGTEITNGFPLRPQGLTYMNGANFGDIDGDGNLEIVTLSYVQNFSPDDPVYVTAYALNQPVENLVFGTYKGNNDRMGWIHEETVLVQCYPIENLTWETGGDCPYIGLFWDLPSETSTGDLIALQVYRDNELIATLPADYTSFGDDFFEAPYETHLYYINAVYSDGCEATSETIEAMWIPDEVDEHLGQSYIYPNPAKDMLRVEGKDILQVELFNMVGQKVLSINENFDAIQLNSLSNGMYFVRLQTKQREKMAKLIIEK